MSEQPHVGVDIEPYYIAGYGPRPMPLAAALGSTAASGVSPEYMDEIDQALDVDMHTYARWVADPTKFVPDGAGKKWVSSQGTGSPGAYIHFNQHSAPTIDTDYQWKLPSGKTRAYPAMLFRRAAWGEFHSGVDRLPGFTVIFVVRIRRTHGGHLGNVFSSKVPYTTWGVPSGAFSGGWGTVTDPDKSTDTRLAYYQPHEHIRSYKGHHFMSSFVGHTERPMILGLREEANKLTHIIGEHSHWSHKHHRHVHEDAYDMSWYLNRSGGAFSRRKTLVMDVVDVCLWDHARSDAHFHTDVRKLNHLYGAVAR